MIKECIICGEEFTAVKVTRKYCDKCQRNPSKALYFHEKKLRASKYRLGEMPSQQQKEKLCKQCCKIFYTYSEDRVFCSDACTTNYKIENAKCSNCQRLLYPLGFIQRSGRGYCSDVCKEQHKWSRARSRGDAFTCKVCGKEFITSGYVQDCCSAKCANILYPKPAHTPPPVQKVSMPCEVCGTVFKKPPHVRQFTCSRECSTERTRLKAVQAREQHRGTRKANKWTDKTLEMALAGELPDKEVMPMHLCTDCKTSQKLCSMFTSGFVYHPEGAKIRFVCGHSAVLSCPQYT